ncbi:MAG: beta-N-acetylhexosaminidase [Microbacterium sp.]|uniref:beta-N-acetylhexosaminidase n=1 Tax=Microbacterium sp. TaxID=51671 RepID=UPI000DB10F01|nr:beta-N-acetylhexosaminidase [Microbacterium sp.]PZU40685.1 MAG: beta-N-acetylhexosaminidase [Microbacterium sp.]
MIPYPARVDDVPGGLAVRLAPGFVIDAPATFDTAWLRAAIGARAGWDSGIRSVAHDAATVSLRLAEEASEHPEGYRLRADGDRIDIAAPTEAGLFYGAQTLVQLLRPAPGDGWRVPAIDIEDAPRFAHRGLMLDVARHFFGVETVCALIDRAAALKLNTLHLHLTDDQGWRLHIDAWPRLTEVAASGSANGDPGGFFTREDYRGIVAHAAARHMTVVPEIDMPGHTHAVGVAYPHLAAAPVLTDDLRAQATELDQELPAAGEPYAGWAVGFSSLRIGDPRVEGFVRDVVAEVAALTPGPYVHIGGDEAHGTDPSDYAAFVRHAAEAVAAAGKTPIAWHEAGLVGGLPAGTVGQYWGLRSPVDGQDDAARAFDGGVILSPADAVYLDMKYDGGTRLGLTWADGPTSVERAYDWDPATVIDGLDEARVRGVEAALWTETIATPADIDEMVFPRIATAAEIAWSPSSALAAERTWESFRVRVAALEPLWHALGIGFFASPEIARVTR